MSLPIDPHAPTQIKHPRTATIRTIVQTAVSLVLVAAVAGPEAIDALNGAQGIPEGARGALVAIATVATALAGVIARVMAIPTVDAWLTDHLPWLSATGRRDN